MIGGAVMMTLSSAWTLDALKERWRDDMRSIAEAPVREMDELNRRLTEHLAKTDSSLTSNF
jgi:hypothetical protein